MARCRTCGRPAGPDRRTCRECSLEDRFGVPADYVDGCRGVSTGRVVDERLDRIRGTWTAADPLVLAFDDPAAGDPVVADVDGELRVLSERVVFPTVTDAATVRAAVDDHGPPRVESLSAFRERFDRMHFEREPSTPDAGRRRPNPGAGGRRPDESPGRSLGSDAYYCQPCASQFPTLRALVDHECDARRDDCDASGGGS